MNSERRTCPCQGSLSRCLDPSNFLHPRYASTSLPKFHIASGTKDSGGSNPVKSEATGTAKGGGHPIEARKASVNSAPSVLLPSRHVSRRVRQQTGYDRHTIVDPKLCCRALCRPLPPRTPFAFFSCQVLMKQYEKSDSAPAANC